MLLIFDQRVVAYVFTRLVAYAMRYLKDIPHPQAKIGLYSWNGKYIVKIEAGPYEQTYKVAEFDISGPDEVETLLSPHFMERVLARFQEMDKDWGDAIDGTY